MSKKTKTKIKIYSHNDKLYDCDCRVSIQSSRQQTVKSLTSSNEVDPLTNRVRKKSSYKTIDNSHLKNLSVADFSLDNLLAVGAELYPCSLSRSTIENLDTATSNIEKISNSINKSNNEQFNNE